VPIRVFSQLLLGDEAFFAHRALVRSDIHLPLHVQTKARQIFKGLATQWALKGMCFGVFYVVLALGKLHWNDADRTLVP
jgi:hypothetical protein